MGTQLFLKRGTAAPPLFGMCLLFPNDWMHQDTTWYKPRPRRHSARWGLTSPTERNTANPPLVSPQFSAHVCCGQTAGRIKMPLGMEVGLGPCDIVLDGIAAPPRKGTQQPPPTCRPMSIVGKRLDALGYHLVWR